LKHWLESEGEGPDDQEGPDRKVLSSIEKWRDKGVIDQKSAEMIVNILDLRDTVAREIMVPRTDVIAVSTEVPLEEIIALVMKHGYSRMPIYEGSVDNIIGILNVKDLFGLWPGKPENWVVTAIMREAYYIPETKNIHQLLHELKEKKCHMAVVIDEYGGTSGIVTLEDLIEEIVGEIHDEHDEDDENSFTVLSNNDILVDSRVDMEDFEAYFHLKAPEGKFETLGGMILHIIKKIPVPGEVIPFGTLEMVIESANERSIQKVRVRKIDGALVAGDPNWEE